MKNKLLLPYFTFVLILSLVLAGCGSSQGSEVSTPTPYPTPIRNTFTVKRGDIVINAELFGRVTPLALYTVYFQMGGHVSEVYAQANDTVEAGQLLAELVELKDLQAQANSTRDEIRRAQINLEIAQLLLEQYKAESRSEYEIEIQELQVELAQMALDEVLEKYGIDPASDSLDELDAQVAKARVYAPANGVIISAVSPGRAVSTTTAAFVIGDGSQLEVVIKLEASKAEEQLKDMFEGMPIVVTPNDKPDLKLSGKIRQLPSPYGTGASNDLTVRIVLDEAPSAETYQSGNTVTVIVQLANKTGLLWLPPEAIRQVGGRTFVIVDSENGPKRIDVEIGLKTPDKIEILSGLEEGQVVIGP